MRSFKHIYYHNEAYLCEEWVSNDIGYKIKLEISEKSFYQGSDGIWSTDFNGMVERTLCINMKMWKMDRDEIHYKSCSVVYDHDYAEW